VVERLPSRRKALGSVPSSGKKRKEKEKEKRKIQRDTGDGSKITAMLASGL